MQKKNVKNHNLVSSKNNEGIISSQIRLTQPFELVSHIYLLLQELFTVYISQDFKLVFT